MKKKVIVWIVVLVLLIAGSGTYLGVTVANTMEAKKQDEQLKAENEKNYIAELFHDQGHTYMTPLEPMEGDMVTLRLRTVRYNVTRAQVQYTKDQGVTWETVDMKLEGKDDTGYYDVWIGEIPAEGDYVYYRFVAGNKDLYNTVYYDQKGINITAGTYESCWQFNPGHDVPDWAMGALWYNIMPDSFYNGSTTNDKQISGENTYTSWNKLRAGLFDRYGGDLDGIEKKLNYLDSLYVDAIWCNPFFKSYQVPGYGTLHYEEVESALGNEKDLEELANAVHDHDMKIGTDVVLTFTQEDSYYFNENDFWPLEGAYQSEDSPFYEMFEFYNWPDHYMTAWGHAALNLNTDTMKELLYGDEDAYLTHYAKILDCYRYDCGGWLRGLTETDALDSEVFMEEYRKAIREVNDELLLVAEDDWHNLRTETWDSQFNIYYVDKIQDYAKGLINETLLEEAMYSYEKTVPRNVALSLFNTMCYHDKYRVVQNDDYMYNAAALIQMTYLGAPVIYYGEEVGYVREAEDGIGTVQSFYGMEWDESNWDQARLNFYKATGELRQKYSCVKSGVVNMLGSDINNNTLMFGRWDENGAAITVTSQNEDVITMEIPVSKCDIPNGTVMTDWYTGAQYVVKDGKITANIIPGGTVIVTGEKSSTYRQAYEQSNIGNASDKNSIQAENTASFAVDGKGTIDKKNDKITYVNAVAYDDFSVFGNVRGDGSAALMIRNELDGDSMYYAAVVKGNHLSIMARTSNGKKASVLATVDCTKNTYVKLERTGENQFSAYIAKVSDGNLSEWEKIEDSTVSIGMNNQVYYGFAPIKGEMNINNITFASLNNASTFDTFDEKVNTTLLDNVNADFVTIKDGRLTIKKSKDEQIRHLLTNSMEDDWTFKSKMGKLLSENEYAGVVSYQDKDNYVMAGRIMEDDKPMLIIGKSSNGEMAVYASVEDPAPDKDIIVQLQRIGAYYSAVYSADNGATWNYIGRLFANFSSERVGLLAKGTGSVSFDWASFGDSINDGKSTNTPHTPIDVNVTYNNSETLSEACWEYLTGDWSLVTGGWNQKDVKGFAQASATNQQYTDLYAEATIDVKNGSGWAGIAFGKKTADSDEKDGFVLSYFDSKTLRLMKNGEQIAEAKIDSEEEAMRLVVEATDGRIIVYAGQKAVPVITLNNTGYERGYVSFCTLNAEADFGNFHIGYTSANWNTVEGSVSGGNNMLSAWDASAVERPLHSISTLAGYGFTDYVCTAKLAMKKGWKELETKGGILLGASETNSASLDGVYIYLDGDGNLKMDVDGKEKLSYALPEKMKFATILIVKQNCTYKVFLKGVSDPVMEYTEDYNRGGALTVYTINGISSVMNLGIENLQPSQDYTTTKSAQTWKDIKAPAITDNFSSGDSITNYVLYNTNYGTFSVKDGVLSCTDADEWGNSAGVTITPDVYSDFTMEFDVRFDNEDFANWMSVGIRKDRANGNHQNSGVSLMVGRKEIYFFDSDGGKTLDYKTFDELEIGDWAHVKIVAKGSTITAYLNGEKMVTFTDKQYFEGFLSIATGKTYFSLDNLKITPMN
ncbi:MAG: DUF1080 domain-containing protein [Tyzzerella sp.]|nr:DUF1080 domain-containing protein [Tyzzerella sp.]